MTNVINNVDSKSTEKAFPVHYAEVVKKYCPKCSVEVNLTGESLVDAKDIKYWYQCPRCGYFYVDNMKYPYMRVVIANGRKIDKYIVDIKEGITNM